ncbi:hypothetical protein NBT05_10020 [Aquimarina sp. ERC-38]|uniref:hypothetical protein n=1 Tax=Aquimarina sp. ERC-38 TaxID=2949996 RepID=UPI002246AF1A|nr:hypothetical protein [Aquimarina sp. ERC-38]UZO79306.1 hypothetical protein NBT05_10020 [Aquimarina sp. ERC-38]
MKKVKYLLLITILLIINLSCNNDDNESTPLPNEVIIEITDMNLSEGRVNLIATQTTGNQSGNWSVVSKNETKGEFVTTTNSLTRFKGSILEDYIIRWTINNGEESVYKDVKISMYEGKSLEEIIKIERNISKLIELAKKGNFTIGEMVSLGVTVEEIKDYLTLKEIINSNISFLDMYDSGITIKQMMGEGFTFKKLWFFFTKEYTESKKSPKRSLTQYFYNEGFKVEDLFNEGISVRALLDNGTSIKQIVDSNYYTLNELITSDHSQIPLTSILELKIPLQTLIDENIIVRTPIDGFYIMNYVVIGYWSNTHFIKNDLKDINRLNPMDNSLWRLPTEDELIYIIKNNKKDFDLLLLEYGNYQYSSNETCSYPKYSSVGNLIKSIKNTNAQYVSCCTLNTVNCESIQHLYVTQL